MTLLRTFSIMLALSLGLPLISIAQQHLETNLLKDGSTTRSSFFNTTMAQHGNLFNDRLELLDLPAGQGGYVEFSIDHYANADVKVGLQNQTTPSESWLFHFQNGAILINGTNYGTSLSNTAIFRVERCDASMKFIMDGSLLLELALSDVNFPALALVEVINANLDAGLAPKLSLDFPILSNCQTSMPSIANIRYHELKKIPDGTFVELSGTTPVLRFQYQEDYALVAGQNDELEFKIYDWDRGNPQQTGMLTKRSGANFMEIPLSSAITSNAYLTLEIEDSKGLKYYLRFLHKCQLGAECINDQTGEEGEGSGGDNGLHNSS